MSNDKYEEVVLDVDSNDLIYSVEDTEAETEEVEMFGVVTDCLKLNIREKPDKNSGIVTVVACLTELKIDPIMSTDDWYAVCTASGIEGFCMKKFVAVRQ